LDRQTISLRTTGSFNPFARPNHADIKLILVEQGTTITDQIYQVKIKQGAALTPKIGVRAARYLGAACQPKNIYDNSIARHQKGFSTSNTKGNE
jgi:hypothetical protein